MPEVGWLTAFLDLPGGLGIDAVEFWAAATGTGVSPVRGDSGQFATLQPPAADACWRVQRLDEGGPAMHLDLHTDDRAALEERIVRLGATLVATYDGVTVLTSPGGLPFCVVGDVLHDRPGPVSWGGHDSMLDQVCLDVPDPAYDAEVGFWSAVLAAEVYPSQRREEFDNLVRPQHLPLRLLVQRVGHDGPVTAHPDLASTDRPAEVARLEALGAVVEVVEEFWTVLRAPDGRLFCVTERDPHTAHLN